MVDGLPGDEFVAILRAPAAVEALLALDSPLLVVDLTAVNAKDAVEVRAVCAALPLVVAGIGSPDLRGGPAAALVDVILEPDAAELPRITAMVNNHPHAATALALLLRDAPRRSVEHGLIAESATYSMLQAGPEFAAWRAARPRRQRSSDDRSPLHLERQGDVLHITLTRPAAHNALNTQMRDALYEALLLAASDPEIRVLLDGEGPSFCAGGDLDEFGTRADPVSAHFVRLRRSIGRLLASMTDRVEAVVHGACVGSGLELPSFASRVVARPDARFGLPEVGMGLIPGAGGTVSITRRVGRHSVAYLALSGDTIDAETALDWGLVDEVSDEVPAWSASN